MPLALYRYALPLRQPLLFNGQRITQREGLLVSINGQWGDIAPLPGFSAETLTDAETESRACLTALKRGEEAVPTLPSVQFGFDCAQHVWPPHCSAALAPYPLLQGEPVSLTAMLDSALDNIRKGGQPPPSRLKLKVARYAMSDELALVARLSEKLPATQLILDANGGWTREEATRFCRQLPREQIDYLEEPCSTFADTIAVADAAGVKIALDETLSRNAPWYSHPHIAALVIKPTLIGALSACEALVQRAREDNLRVVISSSFESDLGLGLLARLARQWAPTEPPGLDTGNWLAERVTTTAGEVVVGRLTCLYQATCLYQDMQE
ncbi:o-succinylbenzoate synthase [Halomonas sp. AOP43-D1-4]|uniref:o-succinylbenzoate synthase n=1 Tax=Halomonas sp. AOP43-D1-4 TaxID=3457658 RepID=UPI00403461AA